MIARKQVLIPLTVLATGQGSGLLEIIIEPAGLGEGSAPHFELLHSSGLDAAVVAAQAALAVTRLPPALPAEGGYFGHLLHEPPLLYVANPTPQLSNSAGAALGVALGLLMYQGFCGGDRLIASGCLQASDSSATVTLVPDLHIDAKLETALMLGPQPTPLPFLVPAQVTAGLPTAQHCADIIARLAGLNIPVLPVASLEAAVTACRRTFPTLTTASG
jgi:hypothetical protein